MPRSSTRLHTALSDHPHTSPDFLQPWTSLGLQARNTFTHASHDQGTGSKAGDAVMAYVLWRPFSENCSYPSIQIKSFTASSISSTTPLYALIILSPLPKDTSLLSPSLNIDLHIYLENAIYNRQNAPAGCARIACNAMKKSPCMSISLPTPRHIDPKRPTAPIQRTRPA